jgi:hypothetical protein
MCTVYHGICNAMFYNAVSCDLNYIPKMRSREARIELLAKHNIGRCCKSSAPNLPVAVQLWSSRPREKSFKVEATKKRKPKGLSIAKDSYAIR